MNFSPIFHDYSGGGGGLGVSWGHSWKFECEGKMFPLNYNKIFHAAESVI